MQRILKIVLAVFLIVALTLILVAGYYGFVPGISTVMRTNKPRNLGITYTEQDRLNGRAKIGWQLQELPPSTPPEQSLIYSGQKDVTATFTSQELTVWINKKWKYIPITDAQIRVNQDSTVEMSGILHTDRIKTYAMIMQAPAEFDDILRNYGRFLMGNIPIYLKTEAVIKDNTAQIKLYEFQLGRYSISPYLLAQNTGLFARAAEWQISSIPGVNIQSLTFQNGSASFAGTLPAVISRVIQ